MPTRGYRQIVAHYEECLERHGDNHLGVDWPHLDDADKRYAVMLDLIRPQPEVSLLDFGCGAGHLYEYLLRTKRQESIQYTGLDLSQRFIELCRAKHPGVEFLCRDILSDEAEPLPRFDYIIANGVFTEKRELAFDEMLAYFQTTIPRLFGLAEVGLAFNVMSKQVDWERDDLFHLPLDTLSSFLVKNVSRHFVVRNDYGLYEYTVYVYREPTTWPRLSSSV